MTKLCESTKISVTKIESVVVEVVRTVSTYQPPSTDVQKEEKDLVLIDSLDQESTKQG